MTETISAKLEKVIYRSLDNSFMISAFTTPSTPPKKFTVTGEIHKPTEGLQYSLEGKWVDNPKFGKQFQVSSYTIEEPADTASIIAYLSRHVKGIGPAKAEYLANKYGEQTLQILKSAPDRVSNENKNISYKLAKSISEQLSENDKQQDVLIKLEGMFSKIKNLPKKLSHEALNLYGLSAYEVIKSNPYVLTNMNRIGFVLADKIAMSCGMKCDDEQRIKSGIIYVIKQMMQESGDIWLKPDIIGLNLSKLISGLKAAIVTHVIVQLISNKILVSHKGLITLVKNAEDEDLICDCVVKFLSFPCGNVD